MAAGENAWRACDSSSDPGIRGKVAAAALPETQIVDLVHCFSREVEHSDENRGLLEDELVKREEFCLKALLAAAVEWKNR